VPIRIGNVTTVTAAISIGFRLTVKRRTTPVVRVGENEGVTL
jgi:hypothetical protein